MRSTYEYVLIRRMYSYMVRYRRKCMYTFLGEKYKIHGALKINDETIWVASREFTLTGSDMSGLDVTPAVTNGKFITFIRRCALETDST